VFPFAVGKDALYFTLQALKESILKVVVKVGVFPGFYLG
jgi:hypothetical protein